MGCSNQEEEKKEEKKEEEEIEEENKLLQVTPHSTHPPNPYIQHLIRAASFSSTHLSTHPPTHPPTHLLKAVGTLTPTSSVGAALSRGPSRSNSYLNIWAMDAASSSSSSPPTEEGGTSPPTHPPTHPCGPSRSIPT